MTFSNIKSIRKYNVNVKRRPVRLIILTFLLIILIGSVLLSMPIASKDGTVTPYLDALFTSASSVCVIGLSLHTTANYWSWFGQVVILLLMQVGGLGLMTIVTMYYLIAYRRITLKQRMLISDSFSQDETQGMDKLVISIMKYTFIIEAVVAAILAIRFSFRYPVREAVLKGLFHSVSAFCNAGFDIMGDASLSYYKGDIVVNLAIMAAVILGGLGFPVLEDLKVSVHRVTRKGYSIRKAYRHMRFHSKMVLTMTTFLLLLSIIFFFIMEANNPLTLGGHSLKDRLLMSAFQGTSMRTVGFYTINQRDMTLSSQLMSMILMFIGGSPSGTAGGIKTVTLGVLVAAVYSIVKGCDSVRAFGRKISTYTVFKALAVFFLGIVSIMVSTMLLTVTENGSAFALTDMLFESTAAFSTTGVSLGLTPYLTAAGKGIIILLMFIGRLGPISLASTIAIIHSEKMNHYDYPEGKIIIG